MIDTVKVRLPIHFDTSYLLEHPGDAEQFKAQTKPEHVSLVMTQLLNLSQQIMQTALILSNPYEQETPGKLAFRTGRPLDEFLVGTSRRRELWSEKGHDG